MASRELIRTLTLAGLEKEASLRVSSTSEGKVDLLIGRIEGKAKQHRFAEAIQIIEDAKATLAEADARQVLGVGSMVVRAEAARSGDADMFRRADALRPSSALLPGSLDDLRALARAGQIETALASARSAGEWQVPEALLSVVEGLTGTLRLSQ